ncbi:hypothetical protein MNB_SUP05-6-1089 [hydrothermal vent metagenome]|uniref:Uncharacterized protein n=1 Tax=hydrothermal vent metagenome TaxID=652676 RepID=A0A1W1DMN7_9ZZZZ
MTIIIHGHTADIHSYLVRVDWMKDFFLFAKRIVDFKHGVILR